MGLNTCLLSHSNHRIVCYLVFWNLVLVICELRFTILEPRQITNGRPIYNIVKTINRVASLSLLLLY